MMLFGRFSSSYFTSSLSLLNHNNRGSNLALGAIATTAVCVLFWNLSSFQNKLLQVRSITAVSSPNKSKKEQKETKRLQEIIQRIRSNQTVHFTLVTFFYQYNDLFAELLQSIQSNRSVESMTIEILRRNNHHHHHHHHHHHDDNPNNHRNNNNDDTEEEENDYKSKCRQLFQALGGLELKYLKIRNICTPHTLGTVEVSTLSCTLRQVQNTLTSLILHDVHFSCSTNMTREYDLNVFANAMESLSALRCFYYRIKQDNLTFTTTRNRSAMDFFVKSITKLPELEKISLCALGFGNNESLLSNESLDLLAKCTFQKLKKLTLFNIGIGDAEIQHIIQKLTTTAASSTATTTSTLTLNTDTAPSINNNHTTSTTTKLQGLVLTCNNITDKGATAIASFLRTNRTINKLNLSHNSFTIHGVTEIVSQVLTVNDTLKHFHCKGLINNKFNNIAGLIHNNINNNHNNNIDHDNDIDNDNNNDIDNHTNINHNIRNDNDNTTTASNNHRRRDNDVDDDNYRLLVLTESIQNMLQRNLTLVELTINDKIDCDPTIRFYLKLNRSGRQKLLQRRYVHPRKWVRAFVSLQDDLDCLYYFLRANPSLCVT